MLSISRPFIKWVGGKTQLLNIIRERYPNKIVKYCEPFVGGGAVLFDILKNYQPNTVMINDINPELINTYVQIRNNASDIINILTEMQNDFWNMSDEERKLYYLNKRSAFNTLIRNKSQTVEKAALFIFLNKTCYNGLYRVNSKGFYNVPMGQYKKPHICDKELLYSSSHLLQNVEILCADYTQCDDFIDRDTFVYVDPPYRSLTKTSFTSYTNTKFDDSQQIKLSKFINIISERGAYVVMSNSDPKYIDEDDNFFDEIYSKFNVDRIKATRMINRNGDCRGTVSELLIYNK